MDLPAFMRLISDGRRGGNPFYIHALATSMPFLGATPIAELIINYAKSILNIGPNRQAPEKLAQMKTAAANRYLRAMKADAALPLISNAIDACGHAYRISSLEEGQWPIGMEREPRSELATFYQASLAQIIELSTHGQFSEAKRILGNALQKARISTWITTGTVASSHRTTAES